MFSFHCKGYGEEYGGSCCIVQNLHDSKNITLSYLDVVPNFVRLYLHTLVLEVNGIKQKPGEHAWNIILISYFQFF